MAQLAKLLVDQSASLLPDCSWLSFKPKLSRRALLRDWGRGLVSAAVVAAPIRAWGRLLFAAPLELGSPVGVSISPEFVWSESSKFLAGGAFERRSYVGVCVWEPRQSLEPRVFRGGSGELFTLAWSPTSDCLAAGDSDSNICIWDVEVGERLASFNTHLFHGATQHLAWSPDGTRLAAVSVEGDCRVFNARTGEALWERTPVLSIKYAVWSPDGRWLVLPSDAWGTLIVEADTGRVQEVLVGDTRRGNPGGFDGGYAADWHPSGEYVAASDRMTKVIRLWSVHDWQVLRDFRGPGLDKSCGRLRWSVDGRYLAGNIGSQIRAWHLSGTPAQNDALPVRSSWSWVWNRTGHQIVFTDGKAIRVWDVSTGAVKDLPDGQGESFWLACSPDGRMLSAVVDGATWVFELNDRNDAPHILR